MAAGSDMDIIGMTVLVRLFFRGTMGCTPNTCSCGVFGAARLAGFGESSTRSGADEEASPSKCCPLVGGHRRSSK